MKTKLLRAGLLVALAALAAPAFADIVHLKNGKKVEGVVEKVGGKVIVVTKFGRSEFAESEVERIEQKTSPKDEFAKRRAAVDATDVAALMELYYFAKSEDLKTHATAVLRDVIKIDPDHKDARALLGYVKVDNQWMSEKEAERHAKDLEAKQMLARGLVQHKGEWVTPEDKERLEREAKGEVLIDGEWVNKRNYEKAKLAAEKRKEAAERKARGEFLVGDKWLPRAEAEQLFKNLETPYVIEGEYSVLRTNRGIDFGDKMIVVADAAARDCQGFFGKQPPGVEKLKVFVAANVTDYNQLSTPFSGDEKSSNYEAWCSPWLPENQDELDMVSVTYAHDADSATELWIRHAVAEQFVNRLLGPDAADAPPRWFLDAFANYIELWTNPSPKWYAWAMGRVQQHGGLLGLKTYFGSYTPNQQTIHQGGRLILFLKDPNCPENLQKDFGAAIVAVNDGKKISKAFRDLEKALTKEEASFLEAAGM